MSNTIHDLAAAEEKYQAGNTSSTYVHDRESVALLRDMLVEIRKMNIHLSYISGLDIQNYNIEDSD